MQPLRLRELGKLGRERFTRRHMEQREPAIEGEAERRREARLVAEIDDVQRATGREAVQAPSASASRQGGIIESA